ncbi:MAG: hypothetical protein ACTHNP_10385 [Solirubrobacterales bacterium]
MISDPYACGEVTGDHLRLGAILLELVADWDAWVSRRVDSFSFVGDDERQLHRQQSVDFKVPDALWRADLPLLDELGGFPVPLTFVRKWRLPQFSLREEGGAAVSLLQREQSVRLGAGMLIALGATIMREQGDAAGDLGETKMPEDLRRVLCGIAADERTESLLRCVGLRDPQLATAESAELQKWRLALLGSEEFMSLAYELAGGFVLMAAVEPAESKNPRRVVKFSYTSYVLESKRDPWWLRLRHLGRWLRNGSRDAVDPTEWTRSSSRQRVKSRPPDPTKMGRLVLSTLCEEAPEGLRPPPSAVAAALVTIEGPLEAPITSPFAVPSVRPQQTIRLRPAGVIAIDGLSPGTYKLKLRGLSGFQVKPEQTEFQIEAGTVTRLHLRTRRTEIDRRATHAPPAISAPATLSKAVLRGMGWRSKPLAIRVRSGEGGSYHCEFEAPPGLHVTRGRLLSNLDGNIDGRVEDARAENVNRPHDVDLVLQSTQRTHLYARADGRQVATGYAVLNLRPRIETIVRPALITAFAVLAVLVFLALWNPEDGGAGEAKIRWALVALLLGGPGALAAYVAQTVASRVTNAMLWGLRVLALVPTILSFAAAGALALSQHQDVVLWSLAVLTGVSCFLFAITYYQAEHPWEQKPDDYRQGRHFKSHYSATPFDGPGSVPEADSSGGSGYVYPDDDDPAAAMRDRMLERAGGMTRSTRRAALREGSLGRWEVEVSPALYFDSAESPAVFLRLPEDDLQELRKRVRALLENSVPDGSSDVTPSA